MPVATGIDTPLRKNHSLPIGPSHWLRADVPTRIRRNHPEIPVTHVMAAAVAGHAIQ